MINQSKAAIVKHRTDMGDYIADPKTLTWNATKQGWLTSILELGAWFGTMYSGFLAETLSRKYAILVNVGVFIIGVIVQTTAITSSGHNSILGGRFVTGMLEKSQACEVCLSRMN
jgi:MFS family permease